MKACASVPERARAADGRVLVSRSERGGRHGGAPRSGPEPGRVVPGEARGVALPAEAEEPLPLSDLAARQHCVRSNITQLMDRLEKDGLVRRRADPDDRRSVLAELTPAGTQAHAKGVRALAEAQRAIVARSRRRGGESAERAQRADVLIRSLTTERGFPWSTSFPSVDSSIPPSFDDGIRAFLRGYIGYAAQAGCRPRGCWSRCRV